MNPSEPKRSKVNQSETKSIQKTRQQPAEGLKERKRFFGVINTDYDENLFKHPELIFEKLDGGDADKKISGNS